MRILLAHCYYRLFGGEDAIFETEALLLSEAGLDVLKYVRRNSEIDKWGFLRKAGLYFRATSARDACTELVAMAKRESPDVVHFHNTHPLISPDAMRAVSQAGFPVVATLHNFRFSCVNGLFFRDGHACEDCNGRGYAWPGVLHACYRDSRLQSAAVARSMSIHRKRQTWSAHVDCWIAQSDFVRRKAIEAGFPESRIVLKPPAVPDPGPASAPPDNAPIKFVGRLSAEKGVEDLIEAATLVGPRREFQIFGDGPDRPRLERLAAAKGARHVRFCGFVKPDQVLAEMKTAAFMVVPSRFYETFGRVVAEAFSCGRAVIVSAHGALQELVEPGVTGLAVPPGDPAALAQAIGELLKDDQVTRTMGENARKFFDAHWNPKRAVDASLRVYGRAIQTRAASR